MPSIRSNASSDYIYSLKSYPLCLIIWQYLIFQLGLSFHNSFLHNKVPHWNWLITTSWSVTLFCLPHAWKSFIFVAIYSLALMVTSPTKFLVALKFKWNFAQSFCISGNLMLYGQIWLKYLHSKSSKYSQKHKPIIRKGMKCLQTTTHRKLQNKGIQNRLRTRKYKIPEIKLH